MPSEPLARAAGPFPAADRLAKGEARAFKRTPGEDRRHDLDRRDPADPIPGGGLLQRRQAVCEFAVSAGCARSSFSATKAPNNASIPSGPTSTSSSEQRRVIPHEQVRAFVEQAANSRRLRGPRLNDDRIGARVGLAFLVIVQEDVVAARLPEIACVEPPAALDEHKVASAGGARLPLDSHLRIGVGNDSAAPLVLSH